jgi:multidrug efflux system outer membrane protein
MRPLAAFFAVIGLGGCALGPDYLRPDIDVPATYRGATVDAAQSIGFRDWRQVFTDPSLQKLIDEALAAGPDALLALARIREAEALAGVSRAPLLPQANLSLNTSPTARQPGDKFTSSFLGGAGISWEIDLWGRYRRASEATQAELLASIEASQGVRASLVAAVAGSYFQLAALRDMQVVTARSAKNQREVLRLIQRLAASGVASAAEVQQQESALATTEARLPALRRQIAEAETALSLLLGRHPGGFSFDSRAEIALPAHIPTGLPSSLLERRPDIRQAEARLVAANARVGEAKAMFFPSLSLTALFGGVSTSLHDVLQGDGATVRSLGPNLLLPLFAGGRLVFNRDAALARLDQALVSYRKTILGAFGEVADALAAYETGGELMTIQQRRIVSASEALRLADLRFRAGTTSFLEILDAQRQLLAAETEAAQSLLDRRSALIRLYLALGGGWQQVVDSQ